MCQECPCTFREADPLFPGANGTRWDCEYVDHGLTSVPKQCWSLQPDVTQVFLDYNEILELHPDDFTELTNLQTLTLRENQLGVIAKGIFSGLKELKYLDLANNLIMYPPSDLWNLRQLVYLDLSNNQLLDSSLFNISNLVNLQVLDLHLNQLTDIPSGSLVPLEGLLKFHIYWNQFVLLPDMSQNIFLEEVLVNGNALLTFPKYVFGPLLKPMTYHIVDNPAYDIWGTMLLALPDRSHIKMGNDVSVWVEDQSQSDELLAKDWLVQDGLSETIDLSTLIRICGEEKPQNDRIPPC
ncbi:hypothetical protein SK128_015972 [Halocaridina rubra]|uniref:Uncharacterized protein n=1 Tax=Halocaridina rubra TaxID=373956 RepID=A0AAN8XEE9_HALRR